MPDEQNTFDLETTQHHFGFLGSAYFKFIQPDSQISSRFVLQLILVESGLLTSKKKNSSFRILQKILYEYRHNIWFSWIGLVDRNAFDTDATTQEREQYPEQK